MAPFLNPENLLMGFVTLVVPLAALFWANRNKGPHFILHRERLDTVPGEDDLGPMVTGPFETPAAPIPPAPEELTIEVPFDEFGDLSDGPLRHSEEYWTAVASAQLQGAAKILARVPEQKRRLVMFAAFRAEPRNMAALVDLLQKDFGPQPGQG